MTKDTRDERFGGDSIEGRMRDRIRELIEKLVEEELNEALGAGKSGAGARAPWLPARQS